MKLNLLKAVIVLPTAIILSSCSGGDVVTEEVTEILKPLVKIGEIEQKTFIHEIRVQGNVETDQDVTLSSEMGGLITSIKVKEGQKVAKGQVIATVDASILSSNMQELQTRLEYAEYMLGKQEELNKRGVGSEFDLETAKNQVQSLKASMRSLSTQQGKAIIRAPFTGVIDQVFAHQGQMAGPASPIVRLVNNNTVDIVATISEKHLANIHIGTPIFVSFPNFKDTTIELLVSNVGNYIEPTNRTFRIMANIKKNSLLLPNMLAEVRITDMNVKDGIVIPSKSILKDQDNHDFIYVARNGKNGEYKVSKVNITVIEKYNGEALIKSSKDLTIGEMVVIEGAKGITDGDIVRTESDDITKNNGKGK